MLLSRNKSVTASSTLDGFPERNAIDEEIRTWWSAMSGDAGEWIEVDLGTPKTIQANGSVNGRLYAPPAIG